jgi:hypothetical protein
MPMFMPEPGVTYVSKLPELTAMALASGVGPGSLSLTEVASTSPEPPQPTRAPDATQAEAISSPEKSAERLLSWFFFDINPPDLQVLLKRHRELKI